MELTVLERWKMGVPPQQEKWFLDYVLRSPKDASVHLTAGWHAYSALADLNLDVDTAVEYFGGLGAQTLMIQDLFAPVYHGVYDYSAEAVAHIKATVHDSGLKVMRGDSYNLGAYQRADIVGLDFGDLTAWKTREGTQHRALLDRVFGSEPEGVVLTDVACRYLHLHRERYETLLGVGTCNTYPHYLEAFADWLQMLYGHHVVGGFYHRWSTVMALVPSRKGTRVPFVPTPATPIGLEIVK